MSDVFDTSSVEARHYIFSTDVMSVMTKPDFWQDAIEIFEESGGTSFDFADGHQDLYDALLRQHSRGMESPNANLLSMDLAQTFYMIAQAFNVANVDNFQNNVRALRMSRQKLVYLNWMQQEAAKLITDFDGQAVDNFEVSVTQMLEGTKYMSGQVEDPDMSHTSEHIHNYFLSQGGEKFPTGFSLFDQASRGGITRGEIFAYVALPKAGKTRAIGNGVLDTLRVLQVREFMMDRIFNLDSNILEQEPHIIAKALKLRGEVNEEWMKSIYLAQWLHEQGRQYEPSGVGVIALEKDRHYWRAALVSMMALDYIIEGKQVHNRLLQKWPAHTVPQPHPQTGYYHMADGVSYRYTDSKGQESNRYIGVLNEYANYISLDLMRSTVGYENRWGIRAAAIELAIEAFEQNHARRLRVYDSTPSGGNIRTIQDVDRVIRQDRRIYPEFPMGLLGLDYAQILGAEGKRTEFEAMAVFSQMIPYIVNHRKVAFMLAMQRNQDGFDKEKANALPAQPGIYGGTTLWRLYDLAVFLYGNRPKTNDYAEEPEEDFWNVYARIAGGRGVRRDNTFHKIPTHGESGRWVYAMSGQHISTYTI